MGKCTLRANFGISANVQSVSRCMYVPSAWESEPLACVIPVSVSGDLNSANPYN